MRIVVIRIFFLLSLSFPLVASCQANKIDSILPILKLQKNDTTRVNLLNELGALNVNNGNYKKSDSFANSALTLGKALNFKSGIAAAYLTIGDAFYHQSDYGNAIKNVTLALNTFGEIGDEMHVARARHTLGNICTDEGNYPEALKNLTQSLAIYKKAGSKRGMGSVYGDIGLIYFSQGNYPEALKNQLESLKIDEEFGNKTDLAGDYGNIGVFYYRLKNYPEALKNQTQALKMFQDMNNKEGMISAYGSIGNIFYVQNNYPEALKNHFLSLKLCEEIDYKPGIANAYGNIGGIYADMGNYTDALSTILKSLQISREIGNQEAVCVSFSNIGSLYNKQKKYAYAKTYLDSALILAKTLGIKEEIQNTYGEKAVLDSATGNYKAAFEEYKISIIYADSLKNEESTKKLVSEQMQYDFDKKQSEEKAQQDKKDTIAAADKRKQQIITGSVSVGLLLVLIFSGLLFSRYRLTQRQKGIIEEQKLIVEEKNKEVLDSITYAKRLQDAILPPLSMLGQYFPESLVLYKPKDIVAGDFYWVQPLADFILVAACDCTGHGVPGAMVSVVCSNALNRAVKEFKITVPGKILDKTRELVMETFEKSEGDIKDGMDISLAAISYKPSANGFIAVQWSGAYNLLWYMHTGEMKELTGDKQPIGKHVTQKPFTTHSLQLSKGDSIYLFTDGYADQFGGPKGKKFKYKQLQENLLAISLKPLTEQKRILEDTFESWRSTMEQTDDVCVIGIRI